MKEEKFPNSRKPSHQRVFGEFWNLRGQYNQEKKENNNNNRISTYLTTIPSREVAQTLTSTTTEQGLRREARAANLG